MTSAPISMRPMPDSPAASAVPRGMPRAMGIALAFSALAVCAAAGESGDKRLKYEKNLYDGVQYLKNNQPDDIPTAIARFREARKLRPGAAAPNYWIALAQCANRQYSIAEGDAREAVGIAGDSFPEAYLLLGQLYLIGRKYDEAIQQLERADAVFAERLRQAGRPVEAYPDKERILARFNLGRALYHRAVETPGMDPEAKIGDLALAEEHLRYAANRLAGDGAPPGLDDVALETTMYRGHCLYAAGNWTQASIFYNFAVADPRAPFNPEPPFRYGLAERRKQQFYYAASAFKLVNQRIDYHNSRLPPGAAPMPANAEAYLQLGSLYLRDYPNIAVAWQELRNFLVAAGSRHPWHGQVKEYLEKNDPLSRAPPP